MKTLGEILQLIQQHFKEKNIERPRRIAEELIMHVLDISRMQLYMQCEKPLLEEEIEKLRGLVRRRLKGEPLEYLLNTVSFYGCRLSITPDVLIPRPETEILLDKACHLLKTLPLEGKSAWDLCTGSGCLGIALKKRFPQLNVTLSDLSSQALALATANAAANQVEISCVQGDLLTPFQGRKAEILLCNPPYVSNNDYSSLDASVRDFEPKQALWGGEDGLLFYRRLSAELGPYVRSGTLLFLEIGSGQGEAVASLFLKQQWKVIFLEKDWAGHDRFFFLERE